MLLPLFAWSQGQADWWYFGSNAGIHFTSSGPVPVDDGQINTSEGCASISDAGGNLLFYTDGQSVWDKNHNVMPNGTGLLGSGTSTHSGIIVPRPGNPNDYYVFTVDQGGAANGLQYSRVDLTLNSGNGDVVTSEKNVQLVPNTSEKVAAIKKSNGFWVVTHLNGTDQFNAYEVTSSGVNTTPVISNTGWPTSGFGFGMKASPDAQKIACTFHFTDSLHLFDFNVNAGAVTADVKIGSSLPYGQMYGLEFSPNSEILYMCSYSTSDVRQFDLTQVTAAAISASEVVVGASNNGGGMLQLAKDGAIYCARNTQGVISRINDPNELGLACNWEDSAVVLISPTTSRWGLPTFIQSFFSVGFSAEDHCFGEEVAFSVDTLGVDSLLWNFGDPTSGTSDTSTSVNPTHTYTDTGSFTVTLIAWGDTLVDTVVQEIFVYPRQSLDIGPADTLLCRGDTLVLDASDAFSTYLWQDSSTADTFVVFDDSLVYVTLFGVCDTLTDTIQVRFDDPVVLDLGPDTTFCQGGSITVTADLQVSADWMWNTGDTTFSIRRTQTDTLIFSALNGCGPFADTIIIEVTPNPDSSFLPPDTLNCFDNAIFLTRPDNDSIMWIWSDSSSVEVFEVDTTMTVWLAAFNDCGFSVDTFTAVFNGEIKTELGEDTVICNEDSIQLWGTDSLASYQWNTGDTTDTIWTIPGETENYIVTIRLRECELVESRRVFASDTACPDLDCDLRYGNVFTPNGDGWNDRFRMDSDCEVFQFSMLIYNRWGQLVHESQNISYGWDGYVNGEPATPGTYYFTVVYKDFVVVNADRFFTRGSFTLIR